VNTSFTASQTVSFERNSASSASNNPVMDDAGAITGFLDEAEVIKVYLARPGAEGTNPR
jgi:hypothetical protein